jgi:hypothetical protein
VHSAFDVVENIVRDNPTIESISLVNYEENLTWRDQFHATKDAGLPLLLDGQKQDQKPRVFTRVTRMDATAEKLRAMADSLGDNRLLGVCSLVHLADGRSAQIPMMDFMCSLSLTHQALLLRLLENLAQDKGVLLESGRSYHYYGFRLLDFTEWQVFMGKCLLLSGFADDRYVGHQLVDGHCVLRLSAGKLKKSVPTVVAEQGFQY